MDARMPALKVGTGWISLEVVGEVDVKPTMRGYAPVLHVRDLRDKLEYVMYISAKSVMEALEPRRLRNENRFIGLRFRIRKASEEQMAPYEVSDVE